MTRKVGPGPVPYSALPTLSRAHTRCLPFLPETGHPTCLTLILLPTPDSGGQGDGEGKVDGGRTSSTTQTGQASKSPHSWSEIFVWEEG